MTAAEVPDSGDFAFDTGHASVDTAVTIEVTNVAELLATVSVSAESEVHVTLTGTDGAATTYVVHCLAPSEWILEATKTPGATGILEDLILVRLLHAVAMLDNNAVPRFHRDPGHDVRLYFRVDRVAGADQQQGHDPEYRYSYMKYDLNAGHGFTVLDQSLEIIDSGIMTVAPLETTDLHDFRVLPDGDYLLMAYEPAERDLSGLPFDHPDVEDSQPQTIKDSAIQIVTPEGQAVFTWNSWGIMPLEDCAQHRFPSGYAHINSLQMAGGLVMWAAPQSRCGTVPASRSRGRRWPRSCPGPATSSPPPDRTRTE